ncbi:MAG: MFS transporter [Oscillospiraceae bacterium]|nr:MFS transporter [Oscillospiraceae bacterium]
MEEKLTKKFEYKWVILALCFLMVFICLGFCSSTKSLYLDVITKAMNIPRTQFAFNDSARFISSAIINLFFGTLIYKYGVRKLTAFGFIMLISSMLTYAFAPNVIVFCLGGAFLGIGLTFTTTTMASSVIRRWFNKDIGKYTGIVLAANGVGGAVATQILSPLIESKTPIMGRPGYQVSYLLVAVILLVLAIVVVSFLRERPKDASITPTPAGKKKARGSSWVGMDFKTAKTKPYFYIVILIVFITGFSVQGISGVYKAHMRDVGLDSALVTNIISVFSLVFTAAKILVGVIYDKFNLRKVLIVCEGAAIVSFLILAFIAPTTTGAIFGFVYAVAFAFAMPLETLVIPLIANDLFGNANYDKILGYLIAANYSGYALGAPIVNLCFDMMGTYKPVLLILAAVMLASFIVFQFVITVSNKEKEKIIAAAQNS